MKPSFRRSIAVWFGLAALTLTLIGAVAYVGIEAFLNKAEWVEHTHTVIETLQATFSDLQDTDSGQRGFILTEQERYLAPYFAAKLALPHHLQTLRKLTADNPQQQHRLDRLQSMIAQKETVLAQTIALCQKGGRAAALPLVLTNRGPDLMQQIRILVHEMQSEEADLLKQRAAESATQARNTVLTFLFGIGLNLFILQFTYSLMSREMAQRQAAEEAEQKANGQLKAAHQELQLHAAQLEKYSAEMNVITAMAELLQTCRGSDELYKVAGHQLQQLFPDWFGSVSILSASDNYVETMVSFGPPGPRQADTQDATTQSAVTPAVTKTVFDPDDCWALRRGHFLMVPAGSAAPLCRHFTPEREAALSVTGFLCMPLLVGRETLGLLHLSPPVGTPLTGTEEQLARTAAEHISLSLANLRLQERLRNQSIRDPLTGLFNRRYLEESFERELRRAERSNVGIGLLMLDIDHFKRVNDTYGHDAGDVLLVAVAETLQKATRGGDIACRYGGEEFAVLLPGASLAAAAHKAEFIRHQIGMLHVAHGQQTLGKISTSVGVAAYPDQGNTDEALLSAADQALYRAKRAGRDQVMLASDEPPATS